MIAILTVMDPNEFDQWLANQTATNMTMRGG